MILLIRPYDDTNNVYGLCYHRDADDKDDDRLLNTERKKILCEQMLNVHKVQRHPIIFKRMLMMVMTI